MASFSALSMFLIALGMATFFIFPPVGMGLFLLGMFGTMCSLTFQATSSAWQLTAWASKAFLTAGLHLGKMLQQPKLNLAMSQLADEQGLTLVRKLTGHSIEHEERTYDVLIEHKVQERRWLTCYSLSGRSHIPMELKLHQSQEEGAKRLLWFGSEEEVTKARQVFDEWRPYQDINNFSATRIPPLEERLQIHIEGPSHITYALMTKPAREAIASALCEYPFVVEHGGISLEVQGFKTDIAQMQEALQQLQALAKLLELHEQEIPQRLFDGYTTDEPDLKVRYLELLQFQYREHPLTEEASRDAMQQEDPRLRFLGAYHLREEGLPLLRELYQDPAASRPIRDAALKCTLEATPNTDDRLALLWSLVMPPGADGPSPALWGPREAVDWLIELRMREALPHLRRCIKAYDGKADQTLMQKMISALRQMGQEQYEADFIELLGSPSYVSVLAAVEALGQYGTVHALRPLQELRQRAEIWHDHQSLLEAIAHIKSRAHVVAGQLSMMQLLDEQTGGLSVSEEAGALSVSEI